MNNKIILTDDINVVCPWCKHRDTLKNWNESTFNACVTREQKRAFRSLKNNRVWSKDSDYFYVCPICGKWCRGNKLKAITNELKEIEELGGLPLVNSIKEKTN